MTVSMLSTSNANTVGIGNDDMMTLSALLSLRITDMFNDIFTLNQKLDTLLSGILVALNKPNKPETAHDTRPIILLNVIRKLLSIVILNESTQQLSPSCRRGKAALDASAAPRTSYGHTDG